MKPSACAFALLLALVGCGKKSEPPAGDQPPSGQPSAPPPSDRAPLPPVAAIEKALPPVDKLPGVELVGEPIKQAADFPKERWVKTVLFDGKTPYIGFTYVDQSKGNSIKGEQIDGLSPAQIKERLHAAFPSSTMQPIPEGHPITPLTPEEIAEYGLPAEPAWLAHYK
ncbi:MAG TPA: hypothetical protein VM734_20705 [Kofleriaceae bacterium]|jgi:hypothetical protein|nr:hypothetical protein [Kofleriaceae bacterium]